MLIGGLKNKPGSTWRAKEMLRISMLPDTDKTKQKQLDEMQFLDWTADSTNLVRILNAVNELTYTLLRVNGNEVEPPKPAPHPGMDIEDEDDDSGYEEIDSGESLSDMPEAALRAFNTPTK